MIGRTNMFPTRLALLAAALLGFGIAGCEPPNPNANTPTSGHLILFVDDAYAPIIRPLVDTFMVKSPNAKIEIRVLSARQSMQNLLDYRDAPASDTAATIAAVLGRKLLPDEQDVLGRAKLEIKEYVIGYDGLAVAVPASSPYNESTVDRLKRVLAAHDANGAMLDSTAPPQPIQFFLSDQNSSSFAVVRALLLGGTNVAAPVRYFSTTDSVLASVAAGQGITVLGWTVAHRDSVKIRTLRLGSVDSAGGVIKPVRVHPATLVTNTYPLKQPLVGYTFASPNSLAIGFLAWLAKSQDAQYYITRHGMQPENVKLRLTIPDESEE